MVGEGLRGRKNGRGFYAYGDGPHREDDPDLGISAPTLDPEALARIAPEAVEIVPRLFAQIANEAAFALEEEIGSPEDMDTAMRLGFNWPLGPIAITELIGAERAIDLLEALRAEHGDAYLVAPGLR
jgi:3-hydroxyacyl-CoA dehydrogenase